MVDPRRALLAFVADLTRSDAELINRARALLDDPPEATAQAMGFYPIGGESPFERSLRKTISVLAGEGFIRGFEDKYINEMLAVWIDQEFVPVDRLSRATREYAGLLVGKIEDGFDEATVHDRVPEGFVGAALDIEAAMRAEGKHLLSVDLSGGDTVFALTIEGDTGARWRDVLFERRDDGRVLAIRGFDWAVFRDYLEYALRIEMGMVMLPPELERKPLRELPTVGVL